MERLTSWLCRPILCAAALLALGVPAAARASPRTGDGHGHGHVVRAALPPGAVGHIFVLDLENEGETTTFGAGSPATYLNHVLVPQGELVEHYYATGHASLDNYIAQISGQAPTEETSAEAGADRGDERRLPDPDHEPDQADRQLRGPAAGHARSEPAAVSRPGRRARVHISIDRADDRQPARPPVSPESGHASSGVARL